MDEHKKTIILKYIFNDVELFEEYNDSIYPVLIKAFEKYHEEITQELDIPTYRDIAVFYSPDDIEETDDARQYREYLESEARRWFETKTDHDDLGLD